jgi:outer membrane protein TolC
VAGHRHESGLNMRRMLACLPCCIALSASGQALLPASAVALERHQHDDLLTLSLDECIALGLRENTAIRSAYLDRIAQRFDLKVAEARMDPQLAIVLSQLQSRDMRQTETLRSAAPTMTMLLPTGAQLSLAYTRTTSSEQRGYTALSYQLRQPLSKGAGTTINALPVQNARLLDRIRKLQLLDTVGRTVVAIASAYRELQRLQWQEQIAEESLARSRQLLAVNDALIAAGRMAPIEMVQTQADLASLEVARLELGQQLARARAVLANLVGLARGRSLSASDALAADVRAVDAQQALLTALDRQAQFQAQLLTLEMTRNQLLSARDNLAWDIALLAGGEFSRSQQGGAFPVAQTSRGQYLGVQLSIPLPDLAARQAWVQAQVQLEQSQLQLELSRRELEQRITDAVQDVHARWRQIQLGVNAAALSRRKLEIEQEKLRAGRSSNFQLLSYQGDLRQADNAVLNARIAYLNAVTELEFQQGSLLDRWQIGMPP